MQTRFGRGAVRFSLLVLAVAGCDGAGAGTSGLQQHQSAETQSYYNQAVVVPAYFSSTSDSTSWSRLVGAFCGDQTFAPPIQGVVILSYAQYGGPDQVASADQIPQSHLNDIAQLRACNAKILGYVDTRTQYIHDTDTRPNPAPARSLTDIANDIYRWLTWYGVQGIFFDEAYRLGPDATDPSQLPAAEGQIDYVHSLNGGMSVFNWGNPYLGMQQYVDCGIAHQWSPTNDVLYVSYETSYETFLNYWENDWNWVDNYVPTRFINLVHSDNIEQSGVDPVYDESWLFHLARMRNAAGIYITDKVNTYNYLADDTMLTGERGLQGLYGDYAGQDADSVQTQWYQCPGATTLSTTLAP